MMKKVLLQRYLMLSSAKDTIVDTASDGEEALEKVKSFQPDVMILDVMMPKLTGYEVCRKLENRRGMGIILLTVKNDIVDKVLGLGS